ncbi:UvrD-helicase domain-containing protein [Clostridium magnum]|uniref:UvrD-like helicase ATP-binding domain-containing protein n=1 Tax=Clostridium magnum DSM 2767 TaxID=1121326 RepID=A0A162T1M6_9CLOT|nr:UvrD-helicase domain-containing protein [Clostridium magnum]KZL92134.1 hypothetical protein CLMAG_19430 [Clostridium magnum DSM 2767]SHH21005.1 Superfamily I DNA or RNA helicase [Clostridium magnum DSM 2767]
MKYSEAEYKILNNNSKEEYIMIEGKSASGKTTLAIKKYIHMVEEEKINSKDILVLIMNRYQGLTWKRELCLKNSGEMKILTYQGFVRKELIKYWPIVEKNCSKVRAGKIRPEFVSADTANYMMEVLVDYFRKKKGYFMNITSTSSRIASDLVSNISKASLSLIGIDEIGTRLYNSLQVKEVITRKTYNHMDEVIEHYINSFLKQGAVDYGISVYLYNEYLLNDEVYRKHLKKIKYLIVDDLDEISPAELELINILRENVQQAYLFNNPEGAFCTYYGADSKYLNENIRFHYGKIKLDESFSCNKEFINFVDKINERTVNIMSQWESKIPAYSDMSSQLRSEMIDKIAVKIEELIKEGMNPQDIVVISPFNDFILGYEIQSKLKNIDISIINTSKKSRLVDNPYVHCLIVIAALCNKNLDINLTVDDYRKFFAIILGLDLIKASILSKCAIIDGNMQEFEEKTIDRIGDRYIEKYNYLRGRIENYRELIKENGMPLDELFRRAFLELLIVLPGAEDNISICKNLSETAEKFIGVLVQFNTIDNPEEKFLKFIRSEAQDFYSLRELEEITLNLNGVVITNPYNFLTSNFSSKAQIWADINSSMWSPRSVKELTNTYVLRNSWNIDSIYTDEIEDQNKHNNLISIIKSLMRKCKEKIYFYGSEYSINGYEQQSTFSDMIIDILSERK